MAISSDSHPCSCANRMALLWIVFSACLGNPLSVSNECYSKVPAKFDGVQGTGFIRVQEAADDAFTYQPHGVERLPVGTPVEFPEEETVASESDAFASKLLSVFREKTTGYENVMLDVMYVRDFSGPDGGEITQIHYDWFQKTLPEIVGEFWIPVEDVTVNTLVFKPLDDFTAERYQGSGAADRPISEDHQQANGYFVFPNMKPGEAILFAPYHLAHAVLCTPCDRGGTKRVKLVYITIPPAERTDL